MATTHHQGSVARLTRLGYWPNGWGFSLVGLALAFQLFMLAQPLDLLVDRVFDRDDAYYYFRIAQSIAAHGWATFDGIHASSGVQLLWTGLLVPLAWLFPAPEAYLRAVLGLCIAFNLCSAVLLYRFCRLIEHIGQKPFEIEVGVGVCHSCPAGS